MPDDMKPQLIPLLLSSCLAGATAQTPETLLLKDYRPKSIYNIPVTRVDKPAFPIIDMHSHAYASTSDDIDTWVETMDHFGIERTIVLTGATGPAFDSLVNAYGRHPGRFELWCGIDFSGSGKPGWAEKAVAELERCHKMGARGVGEITDKGLGLYSTFFTHSEGFRIDGPEMDPVFQKMAELGMPINIHMAEPKWMYEEMDETNDGLMNGYTWRIDKEAPGIVLHEGLMQQFENALRRHPRTTFIACHFLNCGYDLNILGRMLDKYPNLYADISARYAETAPIPRFVRAFYEKHQDRLLYGTDMGFDRDMYRVTFRILETEDEHFYEQDQFGYHWALHGLGLPKKVLNKLYYKNAQKIERIQSKSGK